MALVGQLRFLQTDIGGIPHRSVPFVKQLAASFVFTTHKVAPPTAHEFSETNNKQRPD